MGNFIKSFTKVQKNKISLFAHLRVRIGTIYVQLGRILKWGKKKAFLKLLTVLAHTPLSSRLLGRMNILNSSERHCTVLKHTFTVITSSVTVAW